MSMTTVRLHSPGGHQASWSHETLDADEPLSTDQLRRALVGEISGIRITNVLRPETCDALLDRLMAFAAKRKAYAGGLNISSAMADGTGESAEAVLSHWELYYKKAMPLDEYFTHVPGWDEVRRSLTAGLCPDLLETTACRLRSAWPGRVERARHPVTGQEMYAGIFRAGAPKLHADHAPYDMPGMLAVHQLGCNIYLCNPGPGGDLRVFRAQVPAAGHTEESGQYPVGNYDLPYDLVDGVDQDVIPVKAGDMVWAPNRFLHDVTPCPDESLRMTFGVHAAMLIDGSLALFS